MADISITSILGEAAKIAGEKIIGETTRQALAKMTSLKTRYGEIGIECSLTILFTELPALSEASIIEDIIRRIREGESEVKTWGQEAYKIRYNGVDLLVKILYEPADDWLGEAIILFDAAYNVIDGIDGMKEPYIKKISIIATPITQVGVEKALTILAEFFNAVYRELRNRLDKASKEFYYIRIYGKKEDLDRISKALKKKLAKASKEKPSLAPIAQRLRIVETTRGFHIEIKVYPEEFSMVTELLKEVFKPRILSFI